MNEARFHRPSPERPGPHRSPATVYRRSEAGETPGRAGGPLLSSEDVVIQAVKLGYKIADEQILKGQDLARRLRSASVRSDLGDVGEVVDHGVRLVRQLAILLVELTETGIQTPSILRAFVRQASDEKATEEPAARGSAAGPRERAHQVHPAKSTSVLSVPIQVKSPRATRVSLHLYRQPDLGTEIYPLYRGGTGTPLKDVRFQELAAARMFLSVDIPENQEPGIYRGYAIDPADGQPIGTIAVELI